MTMPETPWTSAFAIERTLWIGIGNSGRQDDGLGWAFLELLEEHHPEIPTLGCYQLQVEDAERIRAVDRVIFVDASKEDLPGGYAWRPLNPDPSMSFTTHALAPEAVLAWCRELYGTCPEAWLLAIAGREWELAEGLSRAAELHLAQAWQACQGAFSGTGPTADQ